MEEAHAQREVAAGISGWLFPADCAAASEMHHLSTSLFGRPLHWTEISTITEVVGPPSISATASAASASQRPLRAPLSAALNVPAWPLSSTLLTQPLLLAGGEGRVSGLTLEDVSRAEEAKARWQALLSSSRAQSSASAC